MFRRNWLMPFAAGCLLTAAAAAVAQDGETYTLTYVAGSGGTLEIDSGSGVVLRQDSYIVTVSGEESIPVALKVTAVPNNGYRFVAWDDDDEFPTPVRNVYEEATSSETFTASFVKTYILTYAAGTNGKIRVGENTAAVDSYKDTVDYNKTGSTVTAVPNTGYRFVKWSDNFNEDERKIVAVRDTSVTATFEINTYTLTYTAESGGKLQADGVDVETPYPVSLTHGSTGPTVTAVPNAGYRFVEWSDGKTAAARKDTAIGSISRTAAFAVIGTIKINTFEDLKKIGVAASHPLDGSYELTADIDASASRDGGAGFKPIGFAYFNTTVIQNDHAFSGKFYGNGKTISGLYINRPASDSGTGLFGYARNAEIKNVAVVDADIKGRGYVGALAGRTSGKNTIEGCYTSGNVSVAGDSIVGGLVGSVDTGGGKITRCYAAAAVSGKRVLGGLVGRNGRNGQITESYSAGSVTGSGDIVGGLAGYNANRIENSYSTSAVSGNNKVGGFVGDSYWENPPVGGSNNTIIQCYSAGSVSGAASSAGGFVGSNDGSSIINRCYWDTETSGHTSAGTGAGTGVTGKATAEMGANATIAGLNYSNTNWDASNSYPYLISLPTNTITFKAVTQGSSIAAGRVSGKSELAQIVNRGVNGAPVAASLVSDEDGVQVGDSLAGWYLAGGNDKITSGANAGFNAKVSGDTLALSKIGGNVVIEARFALKKYAVTYISRIRADGNYIDRTGGKVEVKTGNNIVETADSVSVTREYGTVFTASAVPDTGYRFRRWGNNPDDSVAVRGDTVKGAVTIYAVFAAAPVSVLTPGRKTPQIKIEEEAVVIPPAVITAGEFAAGPNPVPKRSGIVNFFRLGRRVAACELRIYDATGNIINRIKISDNAFGNLSKRIVGSWDLKDAKGRPVSEGTYLVKGVVKTSDGKSEKISLLLSIR